MNRLTKKDLDKQIQLWGGRQVNKTLLSQAVYELYEYKDIEEELGIDLITLFNILKKDGCYDKEEGLCFIIGCSTRGIILRPKAFPYGECEFTRPFNEFGKTWALTKDELL